MIRFYNTLGGKIEKFKPLEPGKVKLYTCGPTVYGYAHIGNFRAYVFEDLLKRFLQESGYEIIHVMNITDVDDKTIAEAKRKGKSLSQYTQKYIDAFFEDIDKLNIKRADYYPRATQHIPEMVAIIKSLLEKGYAYRKGGSVYFDVSKFKDYGKLSGVDLTELKSGTRIDADEYEKESVHDFALWKEKKIDEPYWDTELGSGRPGWHIECSAMSTKYLGETFDIHCGGVDNIFPHHENEIAQSEAYSGKKFVNYWLHCHHLIVDGEKMSKSKGNQFTLRDLTSKGVDPLALRLLLLSTHYRKMLNFTFNALRQAEASLQRIKDFLYELQSRRLSPGSNKQVKMLLTNTWEKFSAALSDDLNISIALSSFFGMIKKVNTLLNQGKIYTEDRKSVVEFTKKIDRILAVLPSEEEKKLSPEILKKIEQRQKAREEKNFTEADRIRNELLEHGILLEDTKEGVRWKFIKSGEKKH